MTALRRIRQLVPALVVALAFALALSPAGAAAEEIDDFAGGWIDRALDDQYRLGHDVPFLNAPWVGTHNSFNSVAEMGQTLSTQDSNQAIDLVSQLRIGIRSLELDLHRFLAPGVPPSYEPVVCHALSGGPGCSVEKTLGPVIEEIEGWLRDPANSEEVLFLYLEDDLDDLETHDKAAVILEDTIGDLVYKPPAGGECTELPYEMTRADVLAAGKQVVIVANCGVGTAWTALIHSWNEHAEERPFGYEDFPSCGPTFTKADYASTLIRYYEDSTQLTAFAGNPDDGISRATAAAMARCGVDLIGFDQLRPDDGRLRDSVWTWAQPQPRRGSCALMRVGKKRKFGRWISRPCRELRRPVACIADGKWTIPSGKKVNGRKAPRRCRQDGLKQGVPRTGSENQALRTKMEKRGAKTVWMAIRKSAGQWSATDDYDATR